MKFLVVSPHHDDEVIGCGGTIAKYHEKGTKIWVVYITAGWSGIPEESSKKVAVGIREREARNACGVLGAERPIFIREQDRGFSGNGATIKKLTKIIRGIKPSFIYAPHPNEKDFEHVVTYRITKEASWLAGSPYFPNLGDPTKSIEAIRLYEVWTPMRDYFVKEDITSVMDKKIKALLAYRSQLNHLNLVDAIAGLNAYRGSMVSATKKFAEVFQVEKP